MDTGLPETILHIVDGLGLSGKTRNLVSIVSRLDERRFRPVVCRLNTEASPLVGQLEAARVPLHTVPCRDGLNPGVVLRLARIALSVKADIIHCYNPRPMLYGGLAACTIGVRATIASLSAFACHMPDEAHGFLPQRLSTVSRRNVQRNRLAVSSMRFVVAVTRSLAQRFCRYNGVPPGKFRVIPYGADVTAMDQITTQQVAELRQQLGFGPRDVVIGSVGRLVEQKDYPTQLRAFALAAARVAGLRMVIAGDGPLKSSLQQLARDLAIADRVHFANTVHDVPALLRSVDIFTLASKFEPFGVALLEAKAAGLPIVATAVGEIPGIITEGESGVLVPSGDSARMADQFVALARDGLRRVRLGARARLEAEQQSLQAAVAAYEDLYEESLDHRHHGQARERCA